MPSIVGIPTTRISDLFVRQRIMNQIQLSQLDLFSLEMKLATGQRIHAPSEDAPAALRIIGLQRLLERKEQIKANLQTNQGYLTATDSALSTVSGGLADIRGTALTVLGTIATDVQRNAAAQQINQTILRLMDVGNQKFRGRHLFAGADTATRPFLYETKSIEYLGNERRIASYSDIDQLFDSNLHGSEVFGAISDPVLGLANLDPTLTWNTRLSDLRAGLGISKGSISISDGINSTTLDLSNAATIGDVAARIRNNPPAGRTIDVEITATGLKIILSDAAVGDSLTITEVGGGTVADELGILTTTPAGPEIIGTDLDPVLRRTTRLADLLGTKAYTVVRSSKKDADVIFSARQNGTTLNGVTVVYQNTGSEAVNYAAGVLTFDINEGSTTAQDIIDLLDASAWGGAGGLFTAEVDPSDIQFDNASGRVYATTSLGMDGGSGTTLDLTSGLQIVNGGNTHTIDFTNAETVDDLLNILNMADAGLLAEINDLATGIDIRSRLSGEDFMIGENGGNTASQLGVRTFTDNTRLEDLNYGFGVSIADGVTDFTITRSDGVTLDIDLTGLQTIGEVLNAINTHPNNAAGAAYVDAQLAATGNGIELVDVAPGVGTLTIDKATVSTAAIELGLIPAGQDTNTAVTAAGTQTLTGTDNNPLETEGVFNALIRLHSALLDNDTLQAQRAINLLDDAMLDISFSRAELGARQQGLDLMQERIEDEDVLLRITLSEDFDADLVEVISEFTGRQIALEAALRTSGSILKMSLLNYI